jgi:hypothetical protein
MINGVYTSLLLILLLGISYSTFSQEIKISGTVIDKSTGEKLLGANAKLKSNSGIGASSDLEGNFSLTLKKLDKIDTLIISYVGYFDYLISISLNETIELKVKLIPTFLSLQNIEVTAKRPIAEDFVIQELNYLKIVSNPSSSADPLLAVRTMVSSSNTDESASISFRGANIDQTRIFLNEVPIYDPVKLQLLNGLGTFGIFNAKLIKSQLIFPGNPPLEFGNVGSGLVHITTEEKIKKKNLEVSLGLANSGFIAVLPVGKKNGLNLFGNFQSLDVIKSVNQKSFEKINSSKFKDFGLNFFRSFGSQSFLKIYGYGINESYDVVYQSPSINNNFIYSKKRVFYIGNFQKTLTKSTLSINNGLSSSESNSQIGNYNIKQLSKDIYGSLNYHYFFSDFISTKVGSTYDYRSIETTGQFPIKTYALSDTSRSYQASIPIHRHILELYQYSKYSKYPFTVGIGLRKNLPIEGQINYLSFQANFRCDLSKVQFINLAAGRYNNYSAPSAAYYPFLLYQTDQIILDYSWSKRRSVVSSAIYAKNEIGLYDVKTVGFEIFISRSFGKSLTADFAFSTISSKSNITDTNLVSPLTFNPTVYSLKYNIKSNVSWNSKWFGISALVQARPGVPYTPVVGASFDSFAGFYKPSYPSELYKSNLPDYLRTDISLNRIFFSKKGNGSLIIYLTISNAFDVRNVSGYYYNIDYSQASELFFQKRFIYFGFTKTFSK